MPRRLSNLKSLSKWLSSATATDLFRLNTQLLACGAPVKRLKGVIVGKRTKQFEWE